MHFLYYLVYLIISQVKKVFGSPHIIMVESDRTLYLDNLTQSHVLVLSLSLCCSKYLTNI